MLTYADVGATAAADNGADCGSADRYLVFSLYWYKSTDTDAAAAGSGGDAWDDTHVAGGVTSAQPYLHTSICTLVPQLCCTCSTTESVFVLLYLKSTSAPTYTSTNTDSAVLPASSRRALASQRSAYTRGPPSACACFDERRHNWPRPRGPRQDSLA